MSERAPSLTVVVPATDGRETLARCLRAVGDAHDPPEQIVVVTEPRGTGPAEARNTGSARASGDIVVFVDADVIVHADAFTRIRAAFAADPALVALFGSYDDAVETDGVVAGFRNLLHHVVHQRSAGHVRSFWAGLGAVRRSAFAEAGGFDAARYPRPSIEDIELGGRLARLGQIVLDPALQGTHLKEWSLRSMLSTDYHRRGVPWVALLVEERHLPAHLNLGNRERASIAAAAALAVGALTRRPVIAAAAVGVQVVLNRDLLRLLQERIGPHAAAAGVVLHTLHQLTALAAVPAGVIRGLRRRV